MMASRSVSSTDPGDLLRAVQFAREQFATWRQRGQLAAVQADALDKYYGVLRARLESGGETDPLSLRSGGVCWDCKTPVGARQECCVECGAPVQDPRVDRLRYLAFTCHEVHKHMAEGRLGRAAGHGLLADANARIFALRRALGQDRAAEALPVDPGPGGAKGPSRPLLEVLLDPQSIQWLLAIGGALLVLGLVIFLAASGFFLNPLSAAVVLGVGNGLLLAAGCAVVLRTSYQTAGRALSLLACLAMPLNLWFYSAQGLVTVEGGGLWVPALVVCALYAVAAWVLKDPALVYTLVGGVVMAGLLILADRNPENFWQITAPATMLVALGVVCIHAERAFPAGEGPFSRGRFGLAFFWAGHASLGAGLLLLLGAQLAGGPLFPLLEGAFAAHGAVPADVAVKPGGKRLALLLVLVGFYAYVYSDVVVRRVGVYLSLAVVTLLWAELLAVGLVDWPLNPVEVAILTLALTGLLVNVGGQGLADREGRLADVAGTLGLVLNVMPVCLGVYLYFLAVGGIGYRLGWAYVGGMALTAASCRLAAYFHRGRAGLEAVSLFGAGASVLVGLVGLLLAVEPTLRWHQRAAVVMLIPIAYLVAGRLARGQSREGPLTWVAHAGAVVMLLSSVFTAVPGFAEVRHDTLNLYLALFFAEAAVFYGLESAFRREGVFGVEGAGVYAAAVMSAAAVWQVLAYFDVPAPVYTLGFAAVGLGLLVCYRFLVLEGAGSTQWTAGAFWAGSALLLVASAAGALRTLWELDLGRVGGAGVGLAVLVPGVLAAFNLAALVLVRETGWRRLYVVSTIVETALAVLTLAVLIDLTFWEKVEVVVVAMGLLLLLAGHVGLVREKEGHGALTSFALVLGCLLAGYPLTNATLYCRLYWAQLDAFHSLNEVGMLVVGLLLLGTGCVLRVKFTTLAGAVMTGLWLLSLVLYARLPERLQTTAIYLMIGGGAFFGTGLLLSVYRDRLLTLPERFRRRAGVFRVLTWR
jgi:hypothetical protein